MTSEAVQNPATARQLAYIKRLRTEFGVDAPNEKGEMSSALASQIIGELIAKSHQNGRENGKSKLQKINEPRLGMAMKECFRLHTKLGRDIWHERRELFIQKAIQHTRSSPKWPKEWNKAPESAAKSHPKSSFIDLDLKYSALSNDIREQARNNNQDDGGKDHE